MDHTTTVRWGSSKRGSNRTGGRGNVNSVERGGEAGEAEEEGEEK